MLFKTYRKVFLRENVQNGKNEIIQRLSWSLCGQTLSGSVSFLFYAACLHWECGENSFFPLEISVSALFPGSVTLKALQC